jgi:hypothetical protein
LAHTCVFAKQSLGPIHCGPPERWPRGPVPGGASLLPKLRDHYAEFLDHVSLVHLRLLALPTCVGLRYGRPRSSPAGFSCVSTPQDSTLGLPPRSRTPLSARLPGPTALDGPPRGRSRFVPRSPAASTLRDGAGIFAGYPSATPLGPRLRVRLTLR